MKLSHKLGETLWDRVLNAAAIGNDGSEPAQFHEGRSVPMLLILVVACSMLGGSEYLSINRWL